MPVETKTVEMITCDNPRCPGHPDLDPHDRIGWLILVSEVYGEPTRQNVFGNVGCLNAATAGPEFKLPSPMPAETS